MLFLAPTFVWISVGHDPKIWASFLHSSSQHYNHWPPPQGTSVFIQLSLLLVQTALLCDVSDHNNRLSILRSSLSLQLFMQNLIWE